MSRISIPVQCTRCRNKHMESERGSKQRRSGPDDGIAVYESVCPRCSCTSYYDLTPQVAWCWASGLIEIGDAMPVGSPDGSCAIEIARGPKYSLKGHLAVVARHGKGESAGKLLVPGVPEADGAIQDAKLDAFWTWLAWCNKRKGRDGVVFSKEFA